MLSVCTWIRWHLVFFCLANKGAQWITGTEDFIVPGMDTVSLVIVCISSAWHFCSVWLAKDVTLLLLLWLYTALGEGLHGSFSLLGTNAFLDSFSILPGKPYAVKERTTVILGRNWVISLPCENGTLFLNFKSFFFLFFFVQLFTFEAQQKSKVFNISCEEKVSLCKSFTYWRKISTGARSTGTDLRVMLESW